MFFRQSEKHFNLPQNKKRRHKHKNAPFGALFYLAERAGFEPAIAFPLYTLSRRAPSTTRTPLLPLLRTAKIRLQPLAFESF